MTTIRAIDPGTTHSAYVDFDGSKVVAYNKLENNLLNELAVSMPFSITHVYIEMPEGYGMAVGKEVFNTCFWAGRFFESYRRHAETETITRKSVKLHLCGTTRAKDQNVITSIVDIFDPNREYGKYGKGVLKRKGPLFGLHADVWQALAVAITAFHQHHRG